VRAKKKQNKHTRQPADTHLRESRREQKKENLFQMQHRITATTKCTASHGTSSFFSFVFVACMSGIFCLL
jgi:hypothetical protein